MGYSGSAPLFVATDGHAMQDLVGIIPVTETILTPWNMSAAIITLVTVAVICPLMRPATNDAVVVGRSVLGESTPAESPPGSNGLGDTLNNARVFSLLLSLGVLSYIAMWFAREGFSLNLDVVIWTFLGLGLLLARSPVHYAKLFGNACQAIGPILLQFPFYAAIMGLLADSGLAGVISAWFADVATEYTLPFWGFLSGGLINMFVPSGGGQWAIQGPVFLQAAAELGTDPALIVMSIAYGDQWTNLIQPFWAIPMLVIAGLSVRDIMGFSFVLFMVSFVIFAATILLVPLLF
jgi:short-chain fatty acids transporter